MDEDDDYKVGYGRPPRANQFRRGRSGNPAGRAKAAPSSLDAVVLAELSREVSIVENGKTATLTLRELMAKTAVQKSAKGDYRMFQLVSSMEQKHLKDEARRDAETTATAEQRKAMLDYLISRKSRTE